MDETVVSLKIGDVVSAVHPTYFPNEATLWPISKAA